MALRAILFSAVVCVAAAANAYTCNNVPSPPAGSICRKNGTVSRAEDLKAPATIVHSVDACRDLAHEFDDDNSCHSYSWNRVNKHCHFYITNLTQSGFKASATGESEYSDISCSACTVSCPLPAGINLITNGGFEFSKRYVGPWYQDGAHGPFRAVSPGENSPNALFVPVANYSVITAKQSLSYLCSNTDYLFSMDYKFTKSGNLPTGFFFNTLQNPSGADLPTQSNTTWITYQTYATKSDLHGSFLTQNAVTIGIGNNANQTIGWLFDNIGLFPVAAPVIKAGATEKIVNGGFESGKLAPWTTFEANDLSITSPGLNGTEYALNVTIVAINEGEESPDEAILSVDVTLTAGSHYLFSLDYNFLAAGFKAAYEEQIQLSVVSGGDFPVRNYAYDYLGPLVPTKPGRGKYQRRIVANAGGKNTLRLDFQAGPTEAGFRYSTVLVDNISLKEIQKPAFA